jgi:hypothetical protein
MKQFLFTLLILVVACSKKRTHEVFQYNPTNAEYIVKAFYPLYSYDIVKKNVNGKIKFEKDRISFENVNEEGKDVWGLNRILTIDSVITDTIRDIYKINHLVYYCKEESGKRKLLTINIKYPKEDYEYEPNKYANEEINIDEDLDRNTNHTLISTLFCERIR